MINVLVIKEKSINNLNSVFYANTNTFYKNKQKKWQRSQIEQGKLWEKWLSISMPNKNKDKPMLAA